MILVWQVSSLGQTDSKDGMGFWESIQFVKTKFIHEAHVLHARPILAWLKDYSQTAVIRRNEVVGVAKVVNN